MKVSQQEKRMKLRNRLILLVKYKMVLEDSFSKENKGFIILSKPDEGYENLKKTGDEFLEDLKKMSPELYDYIKKKI